MAEKVDTANASSEGLSTNHLYYSDTYLFSCSGKLLNQSEREQNGETLTVIVLDQTVMHPQGGRYELKALKASIQSEWYDAC